MDTKVKNLILKMKNENSLWGCRRIADELEKLGIPIHHTTVNRIIQDFRNKGRITASRSWSRFLKAHWDSLYGMDFMTLDTIFGKRFYLLFVLKLSTREIKYWDMTEPPTKEFVRQRIIEIQDWDPERKSLIHDNAPQFKAIVYQNYGINSIRYRPHQGTGRIPGEGEIVGVGQIVDMPILSGLHHHYYRSSAYTLSGLIKLHHGESQYRGMLTVTTR